MEESSNEELENTVDDEELEDLVQTQNIPNYLEQLRIQRNKQIAELAEELNVPYTTYIDWEKGKHLPRNKEREAICKYFNRNQKEIWPTLNEILKKRQKKSNRPTSQIDPINSKPIETPLLQPLEAPNQLIPREVVPAPQAHFDRRRLLTYGLRAGLGVLFIGGVVYFAIHEAKLPISAPTATPSVSSVEKLLYTYKDHSDVVNAVSWSPDGTRIASASFDKTVRVWDAISGQHSVIYRGHHARGRSVAWSPDNTRIVSSSDDKTAQVWEAATGNILFTCRGHTGGVFAVSWSPDGKYIASASGDHTVRVWNAESGALE